MGDIKQSKVWIVGNGMIIDTGYMTEAEVNEFYKMSSDARKLFIEEYIAKFPKAFINTAGFCTFRRKHMSEKDCIACARAQGMTKLAEFNVCRSQHLSRP